MFGSDLQRNRSPFCMAWALLAWLPLGSCSLRHRLAFCLIDEEAGGEVREVGTKFFDAERERSLERAHHATRERLEHTYESKILL